MPRVSLSAKDAVESKLGIQEGNIEVIGAVVKAHQYPMSQKTGKQSDPFPCVQLEVVKLDDKGERMPDAESEKIELGIGGTARDASYEDVQADPSKWKFHPGKASGPDDEEPEDLGVEVDTEGNCIYATDETAQLNKQCKWIQFSSSLEDKGFKSEVLGRGYMPDLVGLKCHVSTKTLEKRSNAPADSKAPTVLVVDKVLPGGFPYEQKKSGKPASKNGAKTAAKPAPAKAEAANSGDEATETALKVVAAAVASKDLAGKEGLEPKKLWTACQTWMLRNKIPVPQHKPVMDLVKDSEWINGQAMENDESPLYGKIVIDDDGNYSFPTE